MSKYSPFANLNPLEISEIRHCMFSETRIYKKGDIIIQMTDKSDVLGLVESGTAHLVRIDVNGNKSIMDYYEVGDIFGKRLSPQSSYDMYYIKAKEKCRITFINLIKLLSRCDNNCTKHTVLLNNLLFITLEKSQMHLDILSQRTIRQKLITYFEHLCTRNDSDSFYLPLSLSDLADYLSVDRSAMMREIKKMKTEEIILQTADKFSLNKNRYSI